MSRSPTLCTTLVALALSAHAAFADEPLTLSAAVERALAHHPSVATARARIDEAAATLGEARASRGPIVKIAASALRYDDPMVTGPIHAFSPTAFPPFSETLVAGTLSASYTLFDAGVERARTRQAEAVGAAAGASLTASEQATAARVVGAFANTLARSEIVAAHAGRLAAVRLELERARQMVAAGKAAEVEALRAEAALAAAEAEASRAATAADSAERDLARLLDLPVDATRAARLVPWASVPADALAREALAAQALAQSPAVAQMQQQLAAAEAAQALARSAYFPRLELLAAVQEFRQRELDFATDWNAGLSLVVPLWDGGQTARRVARAAAQRASAAAALAQAELEVREGVDRALAARADAESRASALGRAAARLAEVARIQKLLLEVGAGTQIDYLAVEAELAATRAAASEARTAALLAAVELVRTRGELTPDWLRRTVEVAP